MMPRLGRTIVGLAVLLFASSAASPTGDKAPATRQFEFTYKVHVPAVPTGSGSLRLWLPLPQSDPFQTITGLRIESPVKYKTARDAEYSNEYAYFEVDPEHATKGFDVVLRFQIARREHRVVLTDAPAHKPEPAGPLMARFLQPDRLVPLNGVIAELAKEQTQGVTDPLQKAHKVYEYVISTMRYDKSGQGWGRGDAIWACSSKYGNCTDFHSVFIGMMRASGVPARFEIGFPLPSDKTAGDIPGYHCWAEFYLSGLGWVPVDASEAWKNPAKHDYFFGAHDTNRVQFTLGRDIRLGPEQKGDPLNYFIYPYAELDGKPFSQLQTHFAFRDWPATGQTAGGN